MSDSKRPIDVLVASLVGSTPEGGGEAEPPSADAAPQETPGRVEHAVEAMAEASSAVLRTVPGSSPHRLERFCDALAKFFDFGEAEARRLGGDGVGRAATDHKQGSGFGQRFGRRRRVRGSGRQVQDRRQLGERGEKLAVLAPMANKRGAGHD